MVHVTFFFDFTSVQGLNTEFTTDVNNGINILINRRLFLGLIKWKKKIKREEK